MTVNLQLGTTVKHQRISEIAQQVANESELYCVNKFDTDSDTNQFFAAVFAELIVRECVRYFNEDYQRDFDTLWREDLTRGMKEHFGIE